MTDEHNEQLDPKPVSRGNASVTLRDRKTSEDGCGTSTTPRSAARCASIMVRIMVGLIVVFVLSGFQSVSESEPVPCDSGGSPANLGAGFQFATRRPSAKQEGQDRSATLRIDNAFYPAIEGDSAARPCRNWPPEAGSELRPDEGRLDHHRRPELARQVAVLYERARTTG